MPTRVRVRFKRELARLTQLFPGRSEGAEQENNSSALAADSRSRPAAQNFHIKRHPAVQRLQSNSAARTIESLNEVPRLVLLQFSALFFDETVEFVE